MSFQAFFQRATKSPGNPNGFSPYPYQTRLAERNEWPDVLSVPTGVGKTASVVLSWLYRRFEAADEIKCRTPQRLIYCLPMRTLVEQAYEATKQWIENLELKESVSAHLLMGGADADDWDEHPERTVILIGTQDMLLSRALNRGYGMSRYRWPMHFGLLNNDSMWILDETQLMGVGVTTSAQLAGLRDKINTYGHSHTLWMSATLAPESLNTVDHPQPEGGWKTETLTDVDKANAPVERLINAEKSCRIAETNLTIENSKSDYESELSKEILQAHHRGTLTLVVVNRVIRAQSIYSELEKLTLNEESPPDLFLIHSRFRPSERQAKQKEALNETGLDINGDGRIVVATQAIEAGVDLSATTLFTELAPWSSLVQRFGRCNRRGSCGQYGLPEAAVYWIDIDTSDEKKSDKLALPYSVEELNRARRVIIDIEDVGPRSLSEVHVDEEPRVVHVIRRKDVLDLFDTTADLSGNDLDVSRYIRDSEDTDIQFYWRKWDLRAEKSSPPKPVEKTGEVVFPTPNRTELCAVSVHAARDFIKKAKKTRLVWRWNPLDRIWETVGDHDIRPGMVVLLHVDAGGYSNDLGWTGNAKHKPVVCPIDDVDAPEANDQENFGSKPLTLDEHTRDVVTEVEKLKDSLADWTDSSIPWDNLVRAAWWHDVGKAHKAFQTAMRDCPQILGLDSDNEAVWAKSGKTGYPDYRIEVDGETGSKRRGFRHELASALAWLMNHEDAPDVNLIAYLIAAHHGKVRLSIRSLPNENRPPDLTRRFARGIWDGDELPELILGNGDTSKKMQLSLEMMELGESKDGEPSWLARTLALRDQYGPFKLAYLEMLLRVADWRGSANGGKA